MAAAGVLGSTMGEAPLKRVRGSHKAVLELEELRKPELNFASFVCGIVHLEW